MSVQRRVFPYSFKREAVDRVANSGLSAGAVARELGLLWLAPCPRHPASAWVPGRSIPCGAADAPRRPARAGRPAASGPDDQ